MARTRQPQTIEELLDKVVVCMSGCWIWAGGDDGREGYGRILRPGTRNAMAAHRYVYQTFVGPIPHGYDIDHRCNLWGWHPTAHRKCVNPDHLEAVTPYENQSRKLRARAFTCDMIPQPEPMPAYRAPPPLLAPGESEADLIL